MTKGVVGVLVCLTVLLQYRIWLSDDGVREAYRLRQAVALQSSTNAELTRRNEQLAAEVADLKSGMTAIEERARSELGMIAAGESFYQVVPKVVVASPALAVPPASVAPPAEATVATRTAQR
ncbi:MAG: cell division protein FtsB [Gammaproteobacteria bacterium]|jgi:cell division protein FtsB|nr:cell division protein FtsB [Gammaproteobacteria bacterium]